MREHRRFLWLRAGGVSFAATGERLIISGPPICLHEAGCDEHDQAVQRVLCRGKRRVRRFLRDLRNKLLLQLLEPGAGCAMQNGDLFVELLDDDGGERNQRRALRWCINRKLITLLVRHAFPSIGCGLLHGLTDGEGAAAGASTRRRTKTGRAA